MRLIDVDELKKHIRRCDDSATRATFDYVDEDDIDDAPIVNVLEQIRAEIQHLADLELLNMKLVLQIIDKYKDRG